MRSDRITSKLTASVRLKAWSRNGLSQRSVAVASSSRVTATTR